METNIYIKLQNNITVNTTIYDKLLNSTNVVNLNIYTTLYEYISVSTHDEMMTVAKKAQSYKSNRNQYSSNARLHEETQNKSSDFEHGFNVPASFMIYSYLIMNNIRLSENISSEFMNKIVLENKFGVKHAFQKSNHFKNVSEFMKVIYESLQTSQNNTTRVMPIIEN